ncbi:Nn.00g092290.m01.CDS01 [Neocucurbitaria sp. VM-36]
MSTSSQYYRSASHYQSFPTSNHEHLYALTAAWHDDPNHDSYVGPSPSPAAFLHYPQPGVDSASLLHSSAPPAWSPGYVRPEIQEWNHHGDEQGFTSRAAAPYSHAEGSATVALPDPAPRQYQQHQQALNPGRTLPLSPQENAFRSTERFNELRHSSESPANAVDPPFSNHAPKPHRISRLSLSQSQTAPLHTTTQQVSSQPSGAWGQSANTLPLNAITARQSTSSTTPWPPLVPGDTSVATAMYERIPNVGQEWTLAQAQTEQGAYSHPQASVDHFNNAVGSLPAVQRPHTKKKATKVPSSFVERQEKLKVSKRKGPLQEKLREKTHTMRKNKRICVRCRFYKSGCDEGDPCQKCEKITGHARSFREPCYREHLEDTSLVRRCNGREHQEEAEFLGYDWIHNSQLYEMEILWNLPGYGLIPNAQPMRITFRPYSPRRGSLDVAASVWSNKQGEVRQLEQPAYAIYDTANLVPAFERYFSSLQPAIEEWIFTRIRQDEVAFLTYQEVIRMRSTKGSKALDLAMRLQCLSVVSQGYGSVWSNNIPGIREYDYRNLGRSDYEAYDRNSRDRPLPGAMTHQMDVAAVKYLGKLEKAFVKELVALIFKPKIKPWYELFLAFYVIFWNLEYIHHGAQDYIKSKNGTLIENQVSNVVTNQIKKWEFAFPVLLYHWRCTLRGYSPFKLARDNPEELSERGHIDPEGFQYVTKIASLFDRVNPDRFQPPLTGFTATHWSTSSEWIVKLFKEAGA